MKALALLFALPLMAQATSSMTHSNHSGRDSVRAHDGSTCTQSMNSPHSIKLDAYTGENNRQYNPYDPFSQYTNTGRDSGFKLGYEFKFGGSKRIDCTAFYEIVTERARSEMKVKKQRDELEIENLKAQLKALRTRNEMLERNSAHIRAD